MTHREALKQAFKAIRKHGIAARMNFSCCSSCGHYDLGQKSDRFVFWNRQSEDSFRVEGRGWSRYKSEIDNNLHDELNLQWEGSDADACLMVTTLQKFGLDVFWRGDEGGCIQIKPTPVREIV